MFFEIDPGRVDGGALGLPEALAKCDPHPDDTPKHSVYASVYRVLERIPREALGPLHLTTQDGRTLAIPAQTPPEQQYDASMYVELCPVGPRVVSSLSPTEFGRWMTDPGEAVRVPRLFFVDCLLTRDAEGRLDPSLPYRHHEHIADCLGELGGKPAKTVDRLPQLVGFYRTIRSGFYMSDADGTSCYLFPSREELNEQHFAWWRSAREV